jgi:hypothetical protein
MPRKTIKLKVDWHPDNGGNRTLKESIGGAIYEDLEGVFFCNHDAAKFYRAVAKRIAKRAKEYKVTYQDTSK